MVAASAGFFTTVPTAFGEPSALKKIARVSGVSRKMVLLPACCTVRAESA
jgi:hypothetical protein